MNTIKMIFVFPLLLISASAFASKGDGSDLPACQGVTSACISAPVSAVDSKTGKTLTGYIAGEHSRDGHGLWADCVGPLARGKPVQGVTGVAQASAQACLAAFKAAHPKK